MRTSSRKSWRNADRMCFSAAASICAEPRCVSPPGEIPEVEQDAPDKWEMVDFEELVARTCRAAAKIR